MNQIRAVIQSVQTQDTLSLIVATAAGINWHTLVTDENETVPVFEQGKEVILSFKESAVSIAKNITGLLSIRNRLMCTISDIREDGVLSTVLLVSNGLLLTSVITTAAVQQLRLQVGDKVEALIKTTDISILNS